ncbi:MAG: metallophosphoesterase [Gemmatimonadaceae bacterium]
MQGKRGSLGCASFALAMALACACSGPAPPAAAPPAPRRDLPDAHLWLMGDAGADEHNPVLGALRQALVVDSARGLVVVLGDNVYPDGIADPGTSGHAEGERRLRAQVDAVRGAVSGAVFLPGNHDWGTDPARGVEVLSRELELINREGDGGRVRMLPHAGCPGPSVVDVGTSLRLIGLDTEWWLRPAAPRGRASDGCLTTERAVLDSLGALIAGAGTRRVVVAGHHPLASVGPHGGRFGWQQHIFPLRELWSPLWIPLPVIGSIYPLARVLRNSPQDLRSAVYRHYRESIDSVFREHPPIAYASGHEHNLQVLNGAHVPLLLVSGGASRNRPSFVVPSAETRFAERANGFMRLDIWKDGEVRLTVIAVDRDGGVRDAFQLRVP